MHDDHSLALLADRLNHEPVVMLGCTTTEVMTTAGLCSAVGLAAGLAAGLSLGALLGAGAGVFLGVAAFFIAALGGTYGVLQRLQRHKEVHGNHYYREQLHCRLSEWGLARSTVCQASGRYGRGRPL